MIYVSLILKSNFLLFFLFLFELGIIPKTSNVERLKSNFQIFDFKISLEDMAKIDGLNENRKFCWDPEPIL